MAAVVERPLACDTARQRSKTDLPVKVSRLGTKPVLGVRGREYADWLG